MRIKISLFVFLAIAIIFSSCNQDQFDLQTEFESQHDHSHAEEHKVINTEAPEGAELEAAPMTNVQEFLKKAVAPEIDWLDGTRQVKKFATPIELEALRNESGEELELRGGQLNCGYVVNGTTRGKPNKVSSSLYASMGLSNSLNGGDDIFYFSLSSAKTVDIILSNTTKNLGMVLFEGFPTCAGSTCTYRLQRIVDYTRSGSIYGDELSNVTLAAGNYVLIVDSKVYGESNFRLNMRCTGGGVASSIAPLWGMDDLNSYATGNLSPQAPHWSKWNNTSPYDGQVVGGSNKMMFIERKSGADNQNPDILLQISPNPPHGYQHVGFDMWVPANRSAYFNLQKDLSYQNTSNEFGAQVFFYNNSTGVVKIAGEQYYFTYPQNRWFKVFLDVHHKDGFNEIFLSIDYDEIASFPARWSSNTKYGSYGFEAVDFYPAYSDSKFWIDNVEVEMQF